jgi:glyoxylase-like metal-dependent hydrolase (beta-lactamase superfamily II)
MSRKKNLTSPVVESFFDHQSNTFSYIVKDPNSSACAVVDPVLDFDQASGTISYESADKIIKAVRQQDLSLELLIETHVHADHLSAAPYIQEVLGGKIAISRHITQVQEEFGKVFNEGTRFQRDGSQFDVLFEDEQAYTIGALNAYAMHTPGHTPACMTHVVGNAAFVGDTLFMPDAGTARADFPGGDARVLYQSIQKILTLPEDTKLYICHDYQPNGRELKHLTTVAEQKEQNIHIKKSIIEEEFVSIREQRDATLTMPTLILPSLQVNMRAGHFPEAEDNETVYLRTPVQGLRKSLKSKNSNAE